MTVGRASESTGGLAYGFIYTYTATSTSSGKVTLSVCIKQASYTEDCKNVCSLAKAVLDNRLELWKKLQARSLFATLQGKLEKRKKQPWNIQVFLSSMRQDWFEEAGGK